jgi:hypothetical protein
LDLGSGLSLCSEWARIEEVGLRKVAEVDVVGRKAEEGMIEIVGRMAAVEEEVQLGIVAVKRLEDEVLVEIGIAG